MKEQLYEAGFTGLIARDSYETSTANNAESRKRSNIKKVMHEEKYSSRRSNKETNQTDHQKDQGRINRRSLPAKIEELNNKFTAFICIQILKRLQGIREKNPRKIYREEHEHNQAINFNILNILDII